MRLDTHLWFVVYYLILNQFYTLRATFMELDEKLNQIVAKLNDEQREGALWVDGPCRAVAGAGAGKTTLIIHRGACMIQRGIPALDLMILTFTNKAAMELKHRMQEMVGDHAQYITTGTFHSIICAKILRRFPEHPFLRGLGYDFTQTAILDPADSDKLMKEALAELPAEQLQQIEDNEWKLDDFRGIIDECRAFGFDCHDMLMKISPKSKTYEKDKICANIWHKYTEKCRAVNGIDFDDILVVADKFLKNDPAISLELSKTHKYIMIDEYQDTNYVQMSITDAIGLHHGNVMPVGDEKQSIYGFRFAEIKVMLQFADRYAGAHTINMNRNYRSNPDIIQWANACAYHMKEKINDGQLRAMSDLPRKAPRAVEFINEKQEADMIVKSIMRDKRNGRQGKDIAILYRNRILKNEIERKMVEMGMEYMVVGDTAFYGRAEVKDCLALLRFVFRPWDSIAGVRVLKACKIGVSAEAARSDMKESGITTINYLKQQAEKKLKGSGKNAVPEYTVAAKRVRPFLALTKELRDAATYGDSPEFIREVLANIWDIYLRPKLYTAAKKSEAEKNDALDAKIQNVKLVFDNFLKHLEKGMTVDQSLEEFALMSEDHPDMDKNNDLKVRMMTLHASKGLEFPVVYMIGMDNATYNEDLPAKEIEEERRTAYVGITRAKEDLVITYCRLRNVYGTETQTNISMYLKEVLSTVGVAPKRMTEINQGMSMRQAS